MANEKPHYIILDGLRGTAALIILVFHYMEMIYPDYQQSPLGHGFLAVDFFYCLSGFVIGYAYDNRIKTEGKKYFFVNRLIRLHPLVILGSLVGFVGFIADPFVAGVAEAGWGKLLLALTGSLLLIPTPILPFRGGALFPYNSPSWSLFFEYLVNILYAYVLIRLGKKLLLVAAAITGLWLGYTAYKSGWLINGWDAKTWTDGMPRVCYSFIAGLCVFRLNLTWKNRLGFIMPLLLLLATFLLPHINNDWITESITVLFIFPLIIAIGARATAGKYINRVCVFIGKLSYPLYMTHITAVWIFGNYYNQYHYSGAKLISIVSASALLNLIIAYFAMKFFDEPVRKWLKDKPAKLQATQPVPQEIIT